LIGSNKERKMQGRKTLGHQMPKMNLTVESSVASQSFLASLVFSSKDSMVKKSNKNKKRDSFLVYSPFL
jgi:hypothetical protein